MNGIELIAQERARQVSEEGWTPEHDDRHVGGELAGAAVCYAVQHLRIGNDFLRRKVETLAGELWPWATSYWKPSKDPIRNLVKAGALIAAEIDRLQRAEAKESSNAE